MENRNDDSADDQPRKLPANFRRGRGGRVPDPQGYRKKTVSLKISEVEKNAIERARIAAQLEKGKLINTSDFLRSRLLVGGEPLHITYPPPIVDRRREPRGSSPKPPP